MDSHPIDSTLLPAYNEKGEALSPKLPETIKNFLIDLDGTVCDDVPNEEPTRMSSVLPYPDALKIINKWYDEGHIITFFTSRTENHRSITEIWLNRHGFKYHGIIFGKPRGGNYHWIDNHIVKATRFKGKFTDLVVEKHEIEVFNKD
ncbi:MAG: phosphoheptose isomerase [Haliscomenobacter sp.]